MNQSSLGIKCEFRGSANVYWTEWEGTDGERRSVPYTNHEEYFRHEMYIYGTQYNETIIPQGIWYSNFASSN